MAADRVDLMAWLRERCDEYDLDIAGVFRRRGDHPWPLTATDSRELEARLAEGGHLLPLPKEPAALANILEVSVVDFILRAAENVEGMEVRRGTERLYPDLEFSGPALGGYHAVDVKVARRARNGWQTESRITLYTGNTYFRFPHLPWSGILRPFNDYATHLDVLAIYTLTESSRARVEDLELIVQEAWRIGSKQRSSTTREYIGAVMGIEDLRQGRGEFSTAEEFYSWWRRFPFRVSAGVQRQLDRLTQQQQAELEEYRRREQQSGQ